MHLRKLILAAVTLTGSVVSGATPAPVSVERGPMPRVISAGAVRKAVTPDELARKIDAAFDDFWKKNNLQPAPVSSDAEFLRRLSLDLIGRIPSAAEARSFLDDRDTAKRTKKIDELLAKASHLTHFATVYRQTWLPQASDNVQFQFFAPQFEQWVHARLQDNTPMDKMVREILTVPTIFNRGRAVDVNGLPGRETPFAFNQVNEFKPENVAAAASRLFMGIKIECAQCHNHPFAPYKRDQFWEMAAFFADLQPAVANVGDAKSKRELRIPDTTKVVQARYFDGQTPKFDDRKSPRETFANWLTADDNPYFAKNLVNRTWAHLLGLGLVEPIDEPAEDNPPVIADVYESLADGLIAAKYDVRFLIRTIARTKVYQLSSRQTHESQADPKTFARMSPKVMSADQIFSSVMLATGLIERTPARDRPFVGGPRREFLTQFSSTEKATERQTSILQALTLMNGKFVNDQTSLDRSTFLAGVIDSPFWDSAKKVEVLYLASLSRLPTPDESNKLASYIERGGTTGDKKKAVTDVFWALLNSNEFLLNH
jgi:Protein of unknown function (DUF1549)/Protein of unknown function (DUF1553)